MTGKLYLSAKRVPRIYRVLVMAMLWMLLQPTWVLGQVRSGAAFLKMLPGARLQSMGGSYTGVLDEMHGIYANPGAGGLVRQWYWAASYTKWFAGIYNASLLYGHRVNTPWSQFTHLNLGVLYQGVPEFDSSDRYVSAASAYDLVVSGNIGQPISFITPHLSAGSTVKYYQSKLGIHDASAWIYDAGMLYRTPRFVLLPNLGSPLHYGIFAAGISLTNMGNDIKFLSVATPLPQALRAGLSFNAGTHNGLQVQLSADYQKRRDEGENYAFGAEFTWNQRLAIQGGYDTNMDLMSQYTFGLSVRLDDQNTPVKSMLPGRNNALRVDLASINELDFFSNTYRGTVSHYPIGPESFSFNSPELDSWVDADSVKLMWHSSREPDLFDDLKYALIVDRDSSKVARFMERLDTELPTLTQADPRFLMALTNYAATDALLPDIKGGDYYWAVIAYDRDWHMRPAKKEGREIAHFHVPITDLAVESITFDYSSWLTADDYHGILRLRIKNRGERLIPLTTLLLADSLLQTAPGLALSPVGTRRALKRISVNQFKPGEERVIEVDWRTSDLGYHCVYALIDDENKIREDDKVNNRFNGYFYTIPKGSIAVKDTVTAVNFATRSFDLPIITEICFDTSRAVVRPEYMLPRVVDPIIGTLSKRLNDNPEASLTLQGFIDPNAGEFDLSLAERRSQAVRDSMIAYGARVQQIRILPGESLTRRYIPAKPEDALWVFQERRYVKITADEASQDILFQPITFRDIEHLILPVTYMSIIRGYVPIRNADLLLGNPAVTDTFQVQKYFKRGDLKGNIDWSIREDKYSDINVWLERSSDYHIVLQDSLERTFRSRTRSVYLRQRSYLQEHTVAFPLQFDRTDPLYTFYWSNIFRFIRSIITEPIYRFRFYGHACAIGPEWYNMRLSGQRAKAFHDGFLDYTRKNYPELYDRVLRQTDAAQGFGETRPMGLMRSTGEFVLIGDNNMPPGRKYNRRIEINFFSTENVLKK